MLSLFVLTQFFANLVVVKVGADTITDACVEARGLEASGPFDSLRRLFRV